MCKFSNAVILVGGLGSRIKALFPNLPKPLIPVFNKPHLFFILKGLVEYKIEDVILSVGFRSRVFEKFIKLNSRRISLKISLISDSGWRGTGGALVNVSKYLDKKLSLVFNGDSFFNFSINDFIYKGLRNRSTFLSIVKGGGLGVSGEYGSVIFDSERPNVLKFLEKSKFKSSRFLNTGFYMFKNSSFKSLVNCLFIRNKLLLNTSVSLERDILPLILNRFKFLGHVHKGFFIDTGTPSKYKII